LRPASAFGYETDLWTVGRLHQVIQEQYRVAVSRDTIWSTVARGWLDLSEAGTRILRTR
jgi:hypothetical protein